MKDAAYKEDHLEAVEGPLHNEQGGLTLEGMKALRAALNSPAEHFTVDLDIRKFKKQLKLRKLSKRDYNEAVRLYKKKAWAEYHELIGHKGSFPTHNSIYCQGA